LFNFVTYSVKHGALSSEIEKIFSRILEISVTEEVLRAYLSYLWECMPAKRMYAKQILGELNKIGGTPQTFALIGAYLYEAGEIRESLEIAKNMIDQNESKYLKKYSNWYLYIDQVYGIASSRDQQAIMLNNKIRTDGIKLIERIRAAKRVVVVGNSPREKGKNLGANIDSADLVIRFNNYPSNEEINKDYGSKCDIWVRSVGAWVEKRNIDQFKHVVVSGTNLLSRGCNLNNFNEYMASSVELSFFAPEFHYELINILKGPPSAGLMMLFMIYKITGRLQESDIFGFGFVDQLNEDIVNIGKSPAGIRHHWQKELELFNKMIKGGL
jgi:hypothetical protein